MQFIGKPLLVGANPEAVEVIPYRVPPLSQVRRLDKHVVKMAKVVALHDDITLAQYLTDRIRPLVEEDYKRALAEMSAEAKPPARPRRPKGGE
jgi:hypothetical protein